jgi:hypothetical protein
VQGRLVAVSPSSPRRSKHWPNRPPRRPARSVSRCQVFRLQPRNRSKRSSRLAPASAAFPRSRRPLLPLSRSRGLPRRTSRGTRNRHRRGCVERRGGESWCRGNGVRVFASVVGGAVAREREPRPESRSPEIPRRHSGALGSDDFGLDQRAPVIPGRTHLRSLGRCERSEPRRMGHGPCSSFEARKSAHLRRMRHPDLNSFAINGAPRRSCSVGRVRDRVLRPLHGSKEVIADDEAGPRLRGKTAQRSLSRRKPND